MRWIIWLGLVMLSAPALAHDAQMQRSMFADWLHDLQSKKGICCNEADGNTLRDVDWKLRQGAECRPTPIDEAQGDLDGRYCVLIDSVWWTVSNKALIEGKNEYGLPVVWVIWNSKKGEPKTVNGIRCLLKGIEG